MNVFPAAPRGVCSIVGAGGAWLAKGDLRGLVIAADGGYETLKSLGAEPEMVIGDFDSLAKLPDGVKTIRLEREKDDTDMMAAIRLAAAEGCGVIHIFGGTGGRVDHTLANLQCLIWIARRGGRGFLHDRDVSITVIDGGELRFPAGCSGYVSVFACNGEAQGVNLAGLKYRLDEATLTEEHPLGVSNEFCGGGSVISVRDGMLTVVYPRDFQPL